MFNLGPSAAGFNQADLLALQEALKDSYILQEQIGAGGMGTVFKAYDLKHNRTVAIKVLRTDLARSMGPERFQREIETAAGLMHPHIVSVFNSGPAAHMLYYVMPYVVGESLRDRLIREAKLSVGDALRIATQLAGALGYAHAAGIVHRDMKPENILLADGEAWLADFGIARAAVDAGDGHYTTTGAIVGSPDYVSPEQLRGLDVDGRADIYSLGCVLFEMLAGRTPFASTNLEATLLGHMTQSPPLELIPKELRRILSIALAKQPEERFSSAEEFGRALTGAPVHRRWSRQMKRRAVTAAGAIAMSIAALTVVTAANPSDWLPVFDTKTSLDTTRYLLLPLSGDGELDLRAERAIQAALDRWKEVEVVHHETLAEDVRASSSSRRLARAARRADTGRIIRTTTARVGDSFRVSVELLDGTDPRRTLHRSPSVIIASLGAAELRSLMDSLVLRGISSFCRAPTGTASLSAVYSCHKAFAGITEGNLAAADSHFVGALRADAHYARAALWQAQIRTWVVRNPADVSAQIQIAFADSLSLAPRERALLRGIASLRARDYPTACQSFAGALNSDTLDYAAWLGVAECHNRNRRVIQDPNTASGWAFRGRYNEGIRAYRRAFEIHPRLMGAYRHRSFYDLRTIFRTDQNATISGTSELGEPFLALPTLAGDTFALIPYPDAVVQAARYDTRGATAAADRGRDMLRDLAARWSESYPGSSAAAEASAVAAELAGDPRAIGHTVRARGLAVNDLERRRLAAIEVWIRLKFGLAGDDQNLRVARAIADSLLALPVEKISTAEELAPVAILLGKPSRAATLARLTAPVMASDYNVPIGVAEAAAALEAFAALGAPHDSIATLEHELELGIRNAISTEEQKSAAARLFTRPAMIAFPSYHLSALTSAAYAGAFIDAERAFARGDVRATRAALREIHVAQRFLRPVDLTADGLFVAAWLHNAIGESEVAAAKLDAWLSAARWFPPRRLSDIANVGCLMRAMLLRAHIAAKSGDAVTAEQWKRRVWIFWSNAEPEVLKLTAEAPQIIK